MLTKNKKAYYYTLDAFIALIVILAVLLVIKPIAKQPVTEINEQDDLISVLSTLKTGEFDNVYIQQLISEGKAKENLTVLEQITEFYAKGMPEAELLSQEIFSVLQPKENIGIWFNNELIASSSNIPIEQAEQVYTARQIISGIEKPNGEEVTGYSARAFLTRTSDVKYFYFGGYVGDGNLSMKINYEGTLKDIKIEIAVNKDFDIYINNIYSGYYEKSSSEFIPATYPLDAYLTQFSSGSNTIKFVANNLYIVGGYIKIVYDTTNPYTSQTKYYFPGIEGIINLYDSFYVPGNLNNLDISLHLDSSYKAFLTIGSTNVFNQSTSGEQTILISNSELQNKLNYQDLSKKTVPIRLGLQEIQELIGGGNADIVLITDLSGSMDWKMDVEEVVGIERGCNDPLLYNSDTKRLSLVKCLDKMFIDMILNVSGNRVALSAFYGDLSTPYKGRVYYESLTSNADYLKNKIDVYQPQGGTCICCSENNAYNILNAQSSEGRKRFVIVMSDGIPTHTCQAASGCEGTRDGTQNKEGLWLGYGAGCYGGFDDCEVNDCSCASQNANWSSCRVYNDLNAKVYSVGFGPVAECTMASKTLENIATCGNGSYFASSDPNILEGIYQNIAGEILNLSYIEQVSDISGEFEKTVLYPDSYIKFTYDSEEIPYGLVVSSDELFSDEYSGSFNVPEESQAIESKIISYSGPRWTKYAQIDSTQIYNLSQYGLRFIELGDPYVINIPIENIVVGENQVSLFTGISPSDEQEGSEYNKIIYTLLKQALGYSPILAKAEGCIWNIEFFDFSTAEIKVPGDYSGTSTCSYTSLAISYNENDAINYAVHALLVSLDINSDNRIDTKFSEENFEIDSSKISGIPYTYSSEVQVRVWR